MFDLLSACLIFALLSGAAVAGRALHRALSDVHRSEETMGFVRVASGLLVSFTALVLSLLITTVNADFKKTDVDLHTFASMIILLDAELDGLGPSAEPARNLLRQYTASAIASTWPDEPAPSGHYPSAVGHGSEIDAVVLGDMLRRVEGEIRRIVPRDVEAEKAQAASLARIAALLDQRWGLIGEAHSTLTPPFFVMMVLWLVVVFVSFGLTAPRNAIAGTAIVMVALSIAGAVFIILELDGPLDGLVKVGSEPLRHALFHLDRSAAAPAGSGGGSGGTAGESPALQK